jgi:hypothetical protein
MWIVKPPHLSRGWDMLLCPSQAVACIVRQLQTSPRLAVSKYIEPPDLLGGHKYDLRLYLLLLPSADGTRLQAFVHQRFRVRRAARPYTASDWEDPFTHLTNTTLVTDTGHAPHDPEAAVTMEGFISGFAAAHAGQEWEPVRQRIDKVLCEFTAITCGAGPKWRGTDRALLGVDVLLDSALQPHLLEVNHAPNCTGVCEELPQFFDQVFRVAFVPPGSDIEDSTFSRTGFRPLLVQGLPSDVTIAVEETRELP